MGRQWKLCTADEGISVARSAWRCNTQRSVLELPIFDGCCAIRSCSSVLTIELIHTVLERESSTGCPCEWPQTSRGSGGADARRQVRSTDPLPTPSSSGSPLTNPVPGLRVSNRRFPAIDPELNRDTAHVRVSSRESPARLGAGTKHEQQLLQCQLAIPV
jgi:hypothetical protein